MKNAKILNTQNSNLSSDEVMDLIFRDRLKYASFLSDALDHELITPLVIIRGLAESLLHNPKQNPQINLVEISKEAAHLLKILEALSFEEPAEPLKKQNISLKKIVDQALLFFEKSCLEKGISIRLDVDESVRVESEPNRLKSILVALIQNAVESFESKSKREIKNITVHVEVNKDLIHLIISDTGEGIAKETQDYILNELFTNKKDSGKHLNYGLALAYKMAQDLMHKISFVSEKLQGSSFVLTFLK